MKKLKKILRDFAGNNRGAGIVVVLVSMVCVALMGASILFMSYTAVRLKATERQASRDFYSAETALRKQLQPLTNMRWKPTVPVLVLRTVLRPSSVLI